MLPFSISEWPGIKIALSFLLKAYELRKQGTHILYSFPCGEVSAKFQLSFMLLLNILRKSKQTAIKYMSNVYNIYNAKYCIHQSSPPGL